MKKLGNINNLVIHNYCHAPKIAKGKAGNNAVYQLCY